MAAMQGPPAEAVQMRESHQLTSCAPRSCVNGIRPARENDAHRPCRLV
jgi:hypothetical protein